MHRHSLISFFFNISDINILYVETEFKMTCITSLTTILTWSQYFLRRQLRPENPDILEHTYQVRPELNEKVSLWQGDITTIKADAIVHGATSSLLPERGVNEDVYTAAGPELLKECAAFGHCPVGESRITSGHNLPAKYIIHAVGTMSQNPFELASTYTSIFQMMLGQQHQIKSIALPCISTGVFGFDPVSAAHVAIRETRNFLQEHHSQVDRLIFCVNRDEDLKIYEELLQRYFPVVDSQPAVCPNWYSEVQAT